jgi:hypothetical protein
MSFFVLEPEVAGGLGETTILDNTTHPPLVATLEYAFDTWLGDDLLEAFPCYIVTERLRNALDNSGFTGFGFDDVTITASDFFQETVAYPYTSSTLPKFYWLKVGGQAGEDDFGIHNTLRPRIPIRAKVSITPKGKKVNIRRRAYIEAQWVGHYRLVVSERALGLLRSFQLEHCLILHFHT